MIIQTREAGAFTAKQQNVLDRSVRLIVCLTAEDQAGGQKLRNKHKVKVDAAQTWQRKHTYYT